MNFNFDNSFVRELEGNYAPWQAEIPPKPELLLLNTPLGEQLGICLKEESAGEMSRIFSGAELPDGAEPIALAYAGHQFGHFSPQLGDGRALLLGEIVSPVGARYDMQLKGSGRTPFSRNGDGKAAIGPVLREYLVSEAMHALGIPTTRALAAVMTGETVFREKNLPGAVLARIASSHIRVGTLQFLAAHFGPEDVRRMADYTIARHYPELAHEPNPYYALLETVMNTQISLVAGWVNVGFVHGVMNTDNVTLSGETIDYGPCAFLDAYSAKTVFSSIDTRGRYAFGNQPNACQWNIGQLAAALIDIIAAVSEEDVEKTQILMESFPERYLSAWIDGMRPKLGMFSKRKGDILLANALFAAMEGQNVDFTNLFRALSRALVSGPDDVAKLFSDPAPFRKWYADWETRLADEPMLVAERMQKMDNINPLYIPRNHKVEEALAAAEIGNMEPFKLLLEVVTHPYIERPEWSEFTLPAPDGFGPYLTFCGT